MNLAGTSCRIVGLFVLLLDGVPARGQNRLPNPDFAGSLSGWWDVVGVASYSSLDVAGAPGSGSAQLGDGTEELAPDCIDVTEGESVDFGAWLRAVDIGQGGSSRVQVLWWSGCLEGSYKGSDSTASLSSATGPFGKWMLFFTTVTVPPGADTALFVLSVDSGGRTNFDGAFFGDAGIAPTQVFDDGFESGNMLAWDSEGPALVEPDVYRFSDLDLRDPHVYADLPIGGCADVTDDTPFGPEQSFNVQLQKLIETDGNGDGELDRAQLLAFRPFDALANGGRLDSGDGACLAPSPPASCDWRMPPVPRTVGYDGLATGTCLEPLTGTTHGYSPAVVSAAAPCYLSEPVATSIPLLGASVPLQAVQSAASLGAGDPPTVLSPGLLMGFLREADADATLVTLEGLGTAPLSSFLPGGTGNCAAHDDRDSFGGESGWWVYLEAVADLVAFTGR